MASFFTSIDQSLIFKKKIIFQLMDYTFNRFKLISLTRVQRMNKELHGIALAILLLCQQVVFLNLNPLDSLPPSLCHQIHKEYCNHKIKISLSICFFF